MTLSDLGVLLNVPALTYCLIRVAWWAYGVPP
jgi:hypothetical protein